MLSLAMSMIFYGVLVKTETLGSTDGFSVEPPTYFGYAPQGEMQLLVLFWLVLAFCAAGGLAGVALFPFRRRRACGAGTRQRDPPGVPRRLGQPAHSSQPCDLPARLPAVGGALAALSIEHVDPNMAYWTTSGGFVFVTILAGAGSVAAAFVGSFVFELLKSIAYDILPGTWQIFLGTVLLLTILFLPEGIGSLFGRLRRLARRKSTSATP